MPKGKQPIVVDGVAYRMRRGRLVPIPEEWLGGGNVTHDQTRRKRPSRQTTNERRKETKHGHARVPKPGERGGEP